MNYRLAVLTHGDMETLRETVESFSEFVSPLPFEAILYIDGWPPRALSTANLTRLYEEVGMFFDRVASADEGPEGFCGATSGLWELASEDDIEEITHVFWLEHDFRFLRPVDLDAVALVMEECCNDLAQMALMRDPQNSREKKLGGVVADMIDRGHEMDTRYLRGHPWIKHRAYFTTNPSLMERRFMTRNPWPDYEQECEGKFGIDLVEDGYSFGIWGEGEPWVEHIGTRTGFGY